MLSKRNIILAVISLIVLFVLAELTLFLPAFNPNNPPVTSEVAWDSQQTQDLFNRSCADCHSNETVYPWYSYVVPVAWLVNHDVQEGRENFNVSTGLYPDEREEIEENVMEGAMPPQNYITMHPNAALTEEERTQLVTGLENSLSFTGRENGEGSESGERGESGESGDGDNDGD